MSNQIWMAEKHLGKPGFAAALARDVQARGRPFEVFAAHDISDEHRALILQAFNVKTLNRLQEEPEEGYRIKIMIN